VRRRTWRAVSARPYRGGVEPTRSLLVEGGGAPAHYAHGPREPQAQHVIRRHATRPCTKCCSKGRGLHSLVHFSARRKRRLRDKIVWFIDKRGSG
jgi:hypothetical protein